MIATVPVSTLDIRRMTPVQARIIGELLADVWPKPGVTAADRAERLLALGRDYQGDDRHAPRSFAVFELGRVIAHACIVPRTIGTAAGELLVAGLSRVCSDPRQRGRGLGEIVTRAVFAKVDNGDFPCSLFQTSLKVQPFYEKLGCTLVANRFVNSVGENPAANPFWDEVAMRYPAGGEWPEGTIDLRGPGY